MMTKSSVFWINPFGFILWYWKLCWKPSQHCSLYRQHVSCQSCYATNSECVTETKLQPYHTHSIHTLMVGLKGTGLLLHAAALLCCSCSLRLHQRQINSKKKYFFSVQTLCFFQQYYQFVVIAAIASDTVINRPSDHAHIPTVFPWSLRRSVVRAGAVSIIPSGQSASLSVPQHELLWLKMMEPELNNQECRSSFLQSLHDVTPEFTDIQMLFFTLIQETNQRGTNVWEPSRFQEPLTWNYFSKKKWVVSIATPGDPAVPSKGLMVIKVEIICFPRAHSA